MTIDTKELRRLAQAVSGWSNCNQAWLDQSEDVPAAAVGHIDEDGNTYPIATIDCDQYYAAHQSLPLAKFYAAANPAVISERLDRLEAAEKDAAELEARCATLADALRSTAQTLSWMQHGKCRGFSDDLLTTNEAPLPTRTPEGAE